MNKELLDEINSSIYQENEDEIEECCDKGLCIDGGSSWILGNKIINALTEKGYMLVKIDLK